MTNKKALLVGINYYEHSGALFGCVNDALAVQSVLDRNSDGTKNFATRLMAASSPTTAVTRRQLREAIQELFSGESDIALFYFAGHGYIESTGGYLIASDAQTGDGGVALSDVISFANCSQAKNRIIILDSCHSGVAGSSAISPVTAELFSIDSFRGDWEEKEPLKPDNHLMNEVFLRDEVIKDQRPEFRSTLVERTVKIFLEPAHENMFDGFLLPSPPGSQDLDAFKATGLCTPLNTSDWGAFLLQSACRNGDAGLAHRGFEMLDPVQDEKAIDVGIQLATDCYHGDLAQVLRQRLSRSLERATLENASANPVRPDASPSRAIRL